MSKKTYGDLLDAIKEVLEVVDISEFISHLNVYKESHDCSTFTDRFIAYCINQTCIEVDIPIYDILNTKNSYNGKRVMALGIIGYSIKLFFPDISYGVIARKLNNNIDRSNLTTYTNKCKDLSETNSIDKLVLDKINKINTKLKKYIQDND